MSDMPYAPEGLERCPEHPGALVRHIYDADFPILNGECAGVGMNKRTVGYECAKCGRALAAPSAGVTAPSEVDGK